MSLEEISKPAAAAAEIVADVIEGMHRIGRDVKDPPREMQMVHHKVQLRLQLRKAGMQQTPEMEEDADGVEGREILDGEGLNQTSELSSADKGLLVVILRLRWDPIMTLRALKLA